MIKTIVFDFDGTLADTLPLILRCTNKLAEEYGYKEIKDTSKIRDKTSRRIISEDLGLSSSQIPEFIKKFKTLMGTRIKDVELFKDIKEVLAELSKSYKIMILTSNSEQTVKYVLDKYNVGSVDIIFPDASMFDKDKDIKELLKNNNLSINEIVYVGDEVRDIKACRRIGVKIIAVSWGHESKELLQKNNPDYVIETPEELLEVLNPSH